MTTESTTPRSGGSPTTPGRSRMTSRQVLVLVVLLASQFMMAADFSIINVALPQVGAELGFAPPDLQWIATSYALCAAGCTLVFGRVGDYLGRRRIFVVGMLLLAAASVVGGLAGDPATLLVARTLQGLATAAVTPAALALLTTSFTEPGLRARALGLNSVMMSSGFVAGSILGGLLADLLSWRWAFFINIPVALAAILVVPLVVPESRGTGGRIDVPGAVLITTGLFALVFGATRSTETGLDAVTVSSLVLAAALLAAFWVVESRTADALVPVSILRRPEVALPNVAALFIFGGETALIFFTGIYVQEVVGLGSLAAGLTLLGIGIGQILGGSYGPRLLDRWPPRTLLGLALAGQGAFMLPLVFAGPEPVWLAAVIAGQFVNGFLSMIAMLSFMVTATSAVDADGQGMATGLATQSQQVGIAVGIPLVSAVYVAALAGGTDGAAQLSAIHVAIGVDVAVLVLAGLLLWRLLARRRSA